MLSLTASPRPEANINTTSLCRHAKSVALKEEPIGRLFTGGHMNSSSNSNEVGQMAGLALSSSLRLLTIIAAKVRR